MKGRGENVNRPILEEKGDFANWNRVILVEMKRSENTVNISGDRNHRFGNGFDMRTK